MEKYNSNEYLAEKIKVIEYLNFANFRFTL